ncbi:MAG TPA: tRNA pseudouridine(38-40) synthase TruA [Caulobacteraceae bacterium]|jgi:tRNA pseudouridine38-40 synthase|nr:tRNA pseudouridine(38-40) synthase TruA [Caulobacteraceae bacterium]
MPRYRLLIEYDGGPFHGWQVQADGPSVQGALARAVEAFCGERVQVFGAGRTDSGVHATGQVAHIELERDWPARTVRDAINAHLVPDPIVIVEAQVAAPDFHARFSATGRRYLYRILNRATPPALDKGRVFWIKKPLDADAMQAGANFLLGRHDFTTFRDANCQANSPLRTLDVAEVIRDGEEIRLVFAARSFLHRQVRSMSGALAEVGVGKWAPDDVRSALEARDRRRCGVVAPAHGLYLTHVSYEPLPDA